MAALGVTTGGELAKDLARLVLATLSVSEPSEAEVTGLADAMIREGVRVAALDHGVDVVGC